MKFCSKCGAYLSDNCLKARSPPKWHCPKCGNIEDANHEVQVVRFKQSENPVSALSGEALEVYKRSRRSRPISR